MEKYPKKPRMIPVGHAGDDQVAEVREDRFHGFALSRDRCGQAVDGVAGLDVGKNGIIADVAQVVGHPVDHFVGGGAKFFGGHFRRHFKKWGQPADFGALMRDSALFVLRNRRQSPFLKILDG